tara:strand:+ start:511 stop:1167 length:657 start_codon:yes stop_codon:yes gene_type:complete
MALPSSGAISLNEIHIEAGGSSGSQVSMNDADVRDIKEISSGAASSFNNFYGAKAPFTFTGTVGADNQDLPGNDYNAARNFRYRGFSKSATFAGGSSFGTLSPTTNSDYVNNTEIIEFDTNGDNPGSSASSGGCEFQLGVDNVSGSANNINTDASFKKVDIGGTVFNRSDAAYSNGGPDGVDTYWVWSYTTTIPANQTDAMSPFGAAGTSYTGKLRGQ